jgi:N-ethylmaleimide reductase
MSTATTPAVDPLFAPITVGAFELPNRVLMAPLTRNRASQPGDVPCAMNATYYRQRASAGLIITEATQVSPMGKGYSFTPGIHSDEQVAGWRRVTGAVHAAGGRIVMQLWHVGRISHTSLLPDGAAPVAPSAIRASSQTFAADAGGFVDVSEPRALATDELAGVVAEYHAAAERAMDAGFDGVEIHGANGYLLDQFTRDGSNHRDDAYGGSLENRLRFPLEVVDAVCDVWGADAVGYRISPTGDFNDMTDSDPGATFTALATALGDRGLAYLHVVEAFAGGERDEAVLKTIREAFPGVYIGNGGYTTEMAHARLAADQLDAVAWGERFISNPDLPTRIRLGAELTEPDRDTYYGGGAEGYTDYPALTEDELQRLENAAG